MCSLIVTIDLDWASEAAIIETVDFFKSQNIPVTIFATHNSAYIEKNMHQVEVGLHPFFDISSSHGTSVNQVVNHVIGLSHNLSAFRCHRFAISNASMAAMVRAGMLISSNVCTDLEVVSPFKNRFGILEVPVFFEDGGFLWRGYSLAINEKLENAIRDPREKVLLIHPMHFVINTPNFEYMVKIKRSLDRYQWNDMSLHKLNSLRWKGRGIRDVLIELIQMSKNFSSLGQLLTQCEIKVHNLR